VFQDGSFEAISASILDPSLMSHRWCRHLARRPTGLKVEALCSARACTDEPHLGPSSRLTKSKGRTSRSSALGRPYMALGL